MAMVSVRYGLLRTALRGGSCPSAPPKRSFASSSHHDDAMRFGDLPVWATELSNSIREAVLLGDHVSEPIDLATSNGGTKPYLLPSNLLWREPLFDQLIVNVYHLGEVRHLILGWCNWK
ncbi:hypothetical protein REPUB_Repub03eG0103800 [Reevesia pubescens]